MCKTVREEIERIMNISPDCFLVIDDFNPASTLFYGDKVEDVKADIIENDIYLMDVKVEFITVNKDLSFDEYTIYIDTMTECELLADALIRLSDEKPNEWITIKETNILPNGVTCHNCIMHKTSEELLDWIYSEKEELADKKVRHIETKPEFDTWLHDYDSIWIHI